MLLQIKMGRQVACGAVLCLSSSTSIPRVHTHNVKLHTKRDAKLYMKDTFQNGHAISNRICYSAASAPHRDSRTL